MRKVLVLMIASMSMAAFAQQNKKPERQPQQVIFGDGDVIDGTLQAPDVEYVDGTLAARHPSLIKVREDFKEKVLKSAGEL